MEHVLTEQQLAAFEAKWRRDTRITLSWQDLQDLTAEIRRCWTERGRQDGLLGLQEKAIGALQARIEELEKWAALIEEDAESLPKSAGPYRR